MRDDFGHDQPQIHKIIHELLAKLPDEASIRAIDLDAGVGRSRVPGAASACRRPGRWRSSADAAGPARPGGCVGSGPVGTLQPRSTGCRRR